MISVIARLARPAKIGLYVADGPVSHIDIDPEDIFGVAVYSRSYVNLYVEVGGQVYGIVQREQTREARKAIKALRWRRRGYGGDAWAERQLKCPRCREYFFADELDGHMRRMHLNG